MQRQSHLLTLAENPFFCMTESIGIYQNVTNHAVRRETGSLGNFNIHYVAGGSGYVELEGKRHELKEGEAVLYFPFQEQIYYTSQTDPWDIRWIHFYGRGLQEYMTERGMHKHALWQLRTTETWEQAHIALLEEAEAHNLLNMNKISTLTYAVITEFISQAEPLTGIRSTKTGQRIIELLPLMAKQACQPFILEEWADRAGISTHYFCKLFRQTMRMTPMDFVTRTRLQIAKQWLLERPDDNIGIIAEEAGYPSISYFNKRFLEHEGITPSQYRGLFS
jgi:AraC-like DNA-binding protein